MKAFLVAPQFDEDMATEITTEWAREVQQWFVKLGMETFAFFGKDAVRERVVPRLNSEVDHPGVFVFLAHGEKDAFVGTDEKPIIRSDNVMMLKNKFVYAISCESAATLGHEAVRHGAFGFIGFNHVVYIGRDDPKTMGRCLLHGLTALIEEGCNAATARHRVVVYSDAMIHKIRSLEYPSYESIRLTSHIAHNRDYLVHLGDPNWRSPNHPGQVL